MFAPCTVQFTGAATGDWPGCLVGSSTDASGDWFLRLVTSDRAPTSSGNVYGADASIAFRGPARTGTFDFGSPDVLSALMDVKLDGLQAQYVAIKDHFADGGAILGGQMVLDVTSVESSGASVRPRGTLVVTLVNNDPTKSDGATAHIAF